MSWSRKSGMPFELASVARGVGLAATFARVRARMAARWVERNSWSIDALPAITSMGCTRSRRRAPQRLPTTWRTQSRDALGKVQSALAFRLPVCRLRRAVHRA